MHRTRRLGGDALLGEFRAAGLKPCGLGRAGVWRLPGLPLADELSLEPGFELGLAAVTRQVTSQ
jgi:hypothetical protein